MNPDRIKELVTFCNHYLQLREANGNIVDSDFEARSRNQRDLQEAQAVIAEAVTFLYSLVPPVPGRYRAPPS